MKKYLLLIILPLLMVFNGSTIKAQGSIKDSTLGCSMISIDYSFQFPGGNLAKIYGDNSTIGGAYLFKTKKNWIFGADFNYIFGNNVKIQDSLEKYVATSSGYPISIEGIFSEIRMFERGFTITGKVVKVIPAFGPNPNSGIMIIGSLGYIQDQIRIQVDQNDVPSMMGDYARGYDRLSNGVALSAFIGYLYMSDHKLTNFFIGFEFTQAWTKSLRDFNFDTRSSDMSIKSNELYGFKVGWILPLYKKSANNYYYR